MNRAFGSSVKREVRVVNRAGCLWVESGFATFVENTLCVFTNVKCNGNEQRNTLYSTARLCGT